MALFGKGKSDDPLVLMQQGQFKDAVKLLEAKLRRAPHDFSLKMRLAEALEGAGKKGEASELYLAEADAVLQEGDRSKGLALLKKAARLLPEDGALSERIRHLGGVPQQGGGDAFSFDVDLGPDEEAAVDSGADQPVSEAPAEAEWAPMEAETEFEVLEEAISSAQGPHSKDLPGREAGGEPVPVEAPLLEAADVEVQQAEPLESPVAVEGEKDSDGGEQAPQEAEINETAERPFPAMEDHLPLLRALFPELSEEEAVLLDLVAIPLHLNAGDVLVREQEEGDSLFIVARGCLEARGRFESGVMNLAVLSAGDLVGEVAFLKNVPRTATVTAVEPSLVLELPAQETRARLAGHPEAMENLEKILQQRVERTLALLKERLRKEHGDQED
jgi:tetratricopeptide (TPR) repeat protein